MLHTAMPLSDDELERVVLSRNDPRPAKKFVFTPKETGTGQRCLSPSVKKKRPLFGCAFAGAVSVTALITDAATVMHGPRSCGLMIAEKLLVTEYHAALRYGSTCGAGLAGRLVTTDMNDEDFIFGGEKKLAAALESVIARGFSTVFVVTACPPGIIGDDPDKTITGVAADHTGVRIIPVKVDGNLVGDGLQGRMDAYRAAASLIAPAKGPEKTRTVNIIAEKWGSPGAIKDFTAVSALLGSLGIGVNCRFVSMTGSASVAGFNNASLNLPSDLDETMDAIRQVLAPVSDVPFLDLPLPTGFSETKEWLMAVARFFGEGEKAQKVIAEEEERYLTRVAELKPALSGKSVLISSYPRSFNWICDIAGDLGMNIVKAGLTYSPFADAFSSKYEGKFPVEKDYTVEKRSEDIRSLAPDLLLHTYPPLKSTDRVTSAAIPYCPGTGFSAGIDQAKLWARLVQHPCTEGWKAGGDAS
jgi:nitrogenase molybdenum-iron protein alpha/beta subunit